MKTLSLNGNWKLKHTSGMRGGLPHLIYDNMEYYPADIQGKPKKFDVSFYDEKKWMDTKVPGCVHDELIKRGIIDDPYIGSNVLKCRWVEEMLWFYHKEFDACDAAKATLAILRFKQLDLHAIVYLNGVEIARHNNVYYPLEIDVSGKLKEGKNILDIRLDSGVFYAAEKKITDLSSATRTMDELLNKRMWLRKPQSSCGWDWSPRLLNIGITDDVELIYDEKCIITQAQVSVDTKEDLKSADVCAKLFYKGSAAPELNELLLDGNKVQDFTVTQGDGFIQYNFQIKNPRLWWCIDFGSQEMYELEILLKSGQSFKKSFGVRHIFIDTGKNAQGQNVFCVYLNGVNIFAKGANMVPADMIVPNIDNKRYERLIELAKNAGFNFLRVWGGGIYESDYFFELCNKNGILVWQEFICACSNLPTYDKDFLEDVQKEFTYQVRRLSNNPSLIVWCGGNELLKEWVEGSEGLFSEILPSIVKENDIEKYYQPTSPMSFEDDVIYDDDTQGDQHPWKIGFSDKDYRKYHEYESRFPNEGGMLGPVSRKTIMKCLDKGDEHLHSFTWDIHENMLEEWQIGTSADLCISFFTKINPRDISLDEQIYLGGVVQGEAFSEYINNFRRRKPLTASAIFWMYNDTWPCTRSWTVVDYYLSVTPCFYKVKEAFSKIGATIYKNNNGIEFSVVNDLPKDFKGYVNFGVFTSSGKYKEDKEIEVCVEANGIKKIGFYDACLEKSDIAFMEIYDENKNLIARRKFIDSLYYELNLKPANIRKTFVDGGVLLESDRFVMNVCTDLDGEDENLQNMFDIYPNKPYFFKGDDINIMYTVNQFLCKK